MTFACCLSGTFVLLRVSISCHVVFINFGEWNEASYIHNISESELRGYSSTSLGQLGWSRVTPLDCVVRRLLAYHNPRFIREQGGRLSADNDNSKPQPHTRPYLGTAERNRGGNRPRSLSLILIIYLRHNFFLPGCTSRKGYASCLSA